MTLPAIETDINRLETRRMIRSRTRPCHSWSPSEELALRVEFRRGASLDEVACRHGRAVHEVRMKLAQLGELEQAFVSHVDALSA